MKRFILKLNEDELNYIAELLEQEGEGLRKGQTLAGEFEEEFNLIDSIVEKIYNLI